MQTRDLQMAIYGARGQILMLIALCALLWLHTDFSGGDNPVSWEEGKTSLFEESTRALPRKTRRHKNNVICNKTRLENIVDIRSRVGSNCPDRTPWWLSFAGEMSEGRGALTHVNIGCNKGFDFLATLEDFSGNEKYSPEAYRKRLEAAGVMFGDKGQCNQLETAESRPRSHVTSIRHVVGHCIEPNVKTFQAVAAGMEPLQEDGSVFLSRDAFGSFRGQVFFSDVNAGHESGTITKEGLPVTATTLDDYAETMRLGTVDLLSIDTEGNDMHVIYGGVNFLTSHVVRVLEFEVHDANHWHVTRVDNLVALLDNLGFVCYWHLNGEQPLLRATGCMAEELETPAIKNWSNMVCANRNEESLVELFESLSEEAEATLRRDFIPHLTA